MGMRFFYFKRFMRGLAQIAGFYSNFALQYSQKNCRAHQSGMHGEEDRSLRREQEKSLLPGTESPTLAAASIGSSEMAAAVSNVAS